MTRSPVLSENYHSLSTLSIRNWLRIVRYTDILYHMYVRIQNLPMTLRITPCRRAEPLIRKDIRYVRLRRLLQEFQAVACRGIGRIRRIVEAMMPRSPTGENCLCRLRSRLPGRLRVRSVTEAERLQRRHEERP